MAVLFPWLGGRAPATPPRDESHAWGCVAGSPGGYPHFWNIHSEQCRDHHSLRHRSRPCDARLAETPDRPRALAPARKRQRGLSWGCRTPCRLISAGPTRGCHCQPSPAHYSHLHRLLPLSPSSAAPAASPESVCGSTSRRLVPTHPLHDGVCRQHGDWRGGGPRAREQDLLGTCEGGFAEMRRRAHPGCIWGVAVGGSAVCPGACTASGRCGRRGGSDWWAMRQWGSR